MKLYFPDATPNYVRKTHLLLRQAPSEKKGTNTNNKNKIVYIAVVSVTTSIVLEPEKKCVNGR